MGATPRNIEQQNGTMVLDKNHHKQYHKKSIKCRYNREMAKINQGKKTYLKAMEVRSFER